MIYAISKSKLPDIFPYAQPWHNLWINTLLPINDKAHYGYQFDNGQGNWVSICVDPDAIVIKHSDITDYVTGSNDTLGILLSNHYHLIDTSFDNFINKYEVTPDNLVSKTKLNLSSIFKKSHPITMDECIEKVKAKLSSNIKELIHHYGADFVAYTAGLDSSTNATIAAGIDPDITLLANHRLYPTVQKLKKYNSVSDETTDGLSKYKNYMNKQNIKKHFYSNNKVIAGFSGDHILLHQADLYHQSIDLIDCTDRLSDNELYDPANKNYNKFKNVLELKLSAITLAITPQFQLWFDDNYEIYDPYRDLSILETIMQLPLTLLVQQLGSGMIQRKIIESLDPDLGFLLTKNKNVY